MVKRKIRKEERKKERKEEKEIKNTEIILYSES
jgi:hypothetical protein